MSKKKYPPIKKHARINAIKYCYQNAISLLEESKLLFENNKFARALALSILGLEEIGKLELIAQSFFYSTHEEWKKFYENFRSHKTKLQNNWIIESRINLYESENEVFEEKTERLARRRDLNIVKQESIYIGYNEDLKYFTNPLDTINKTDVKEIQKVLEKQIEYYSMINNISHNTLVDKINAMQTKEFRELHNEHLEKFNSEMTRIANKIDSKLK